jgi:hypothetical protein
MLPLLLDEAPPETEPLAPDDSPGELDVPDVVPVLPGDAAGVPDPCASRLHASKSACVGSAANAALLIMHMPATVSIAVARVNFFISFLHEASMFWASQPAGKSSSEVPPGTNFLDVARSIRD